MFAAFLLPIAVRGVKAPYLWFFYKLLSSIDEKMLFMCSRDYLTSVDDWAKQGRWELDSQAMARLGYVLPSESTLALHDYRFCLEDILSQLLSKYKHNPRTVFKALLTEEIPELVSYFEAALSGRDDLEGILTLCNCPSLTAVANKISVPVMHIELGPLRSGSYLPTAYLDFSGVNGNTEAFSRYQAMKGKSDLVFPLDDLLQIFKRDDDALIFSLDENKSIGVVLQVEDDSNLVAFGNDFDNQALMNLVNIQHKEEAKLIRAHPGSAFTLKIDGASKDTSNSSIEFLSKCKKVYAINSSVVLEAILHNIPVISLGDSSFSFILKSESEEEFLEKINFYLFAYLVPMSLVMTPEYLRFRLGFPDEKQIINKHMGYYFVFLSKQVKEFAKNLMFLDETALSKEQSIKNLQLTADTKEQVIKDLQLDVSTKEQVIKDLQLDVSTKEQIIKDLQLNIDSKEQLIESKIKELLDNNCRMEAVELLNTHLNKEIEEIKHALFLMHRSKSWRWTAPLRFLSRLLRNIFAAIGLK